MTSAEIVKRSPPLFKRCLRLRRVRKLKETLVTVQQLDKNMSNLRTWLSRVEAELAEPVVYEVCHADEIQRKLSEQQVQFQRRSRKTSESCLKTGLHSEKS